MCWNVTSAQVELLHIDSEDELSDNELESEQPEQSTDHELANIDNQLNQLSLNPAHHVIIINFTVFHTEGANAMPTIVITISSFWDIM